MRSLAQMIALCALALAAPALAATVAKPELQLLLEERYDDDALLRVGGLGQLITKVSPQAGLQLKNPTLDTRAFYAADLLLHHGSGSLTLDHRGGLEGKALLSRRADLSLKANLWRVSDPTSLPRLGLAYVLAPMLYGRVEASARGDATERLEARAGYRFEGAQVLEPGRPLGVAHAPDAGLSYRLTRRTSAGVEGRLQLFSLGAQQAVAPGAFVVFRHRLSRLTTLTVLGGPVWYRSAAGEEGLSPRLALELGYTREGLELAFAAGQDLAGASGFDAALRAQYVSASVALRVTGPLRLFAGVHGFRDGRPTGEGYGLVGPITAQGYSVGLGLEWRLTRRASIFATGDRFAEAGPDAVSALAERNIIALRLVVKAF
ncbi:MAG: hypothetical protein ACYC8T_34400 [Myxococcaceae bacterium]